MKSALSYRMKLPESKLFMLNRKNSIRILWHVKHDKHEKSYQLITKTLPEGSVCQKNKISLNYLKLFFP